jgi:two-component system, NtrC family, nitrogen regulation sensor histidine kinase NtrY
MGYRRFRLGVAVQIGLILLVCTVAAWLVATTTYYATITLVLIVLVVQVASLLHYVSRTNRELSRFLLAIQHADFSQSFSMSAAAGPFAPLAEAFEGVLGRFREARSAREEQASYVDTLVQHVPVAVLTVDETGRVDLLNNAARRLFGVNVLRNLHDYDGFGPGFVANIMELQPGTTGLVTAIRRNELLQLSVSATELRLRGRRMKIVSLQDIRRELEAREVTAWQNLIRVLTHEIMNSVTPIASLATTAGEILVDARTATDPRPAIDDAKDAVDAIAQRGTGLLHFVESYRRLTRLPTPNARAFPVAQLFSRIRNLMGRELEERGIALTQKIHPEAAELNADAELIEQAIINLVRNAMDAVADVAAPAILMTAGQDATGRPAITVSDNGAGIDGRVREHIFVPFYTTKRHGSGVGLSVVQQIMRSHQGQVEVVSAPGEGTTIRLGF